MCTVLEAAKGSVPLPRVLAGAAAAAARPLLGAANEPKGSAVVRLPLAGATGATAKPPKSSPATEDDAGAEGKLQKSSKGNGALLPEAAAAVVGIGPRRLSTFTAGFCK